MTDKHILIDSDLFDLFKERAKRNNRTIKGELTNILKKELEKEDESNTNERP